MKFLFPQINRVVRIQGGLAQIIGGSSSFVINTYGVAYAWGQGGNGVLGNNNSVNKSSPVAVVGRLFTYITPSYGFGMIGIEAFTGHAYGWGNESSGLLGTGANTILSSPTSVIGGRSYNQLLISLSTSFAIEGSTGNAYCWGGGSSGQLGNNTLTAIVGSPVSVFGARSFSLIAIDSIGFSLGAIEASTGHAYAWGLGTSGQMGNNLATSQSSPVSVAGGRSFSKLQTAHFTTLALEASTGNAYAWGNNLSGQIGNNTVANASSPMSVVGGRSFSQIAIALVSSPSQLVSCMAIEASTGHAYAWGSNANGQLGINTIANASSPVSVVGGRSFSQVYPLGLTSFAIEGSTGSLYAWGLNGIGNLGTGNLLNQSSPTLVLGGRSISGFLGTAAQSPSGNSPVILVREASTGQIFGWGDNSLLQLAYSNTQNTPLAVLGGRTFSQAANDSNENLTLAIEASTGNAYAWGVGTAGQMGNNLIFNASSPVSVVGGRSFNRVYALSNFALAIEASTGNAYAWGVGGSGQLGSNSAANQSSPFSVVGGRSFTQLFPNTEASTVSPQVYGIEGSTGAVYGWGVNTSGQLGNAIITTVNATSPLSIAALLIASKSFSQLVNTGFANTVYAIEGSTGFVYAWGGALSGQLGNNSTANQFAPSLVLGGRSFQQLSASSGQFVTGIEGSTGNAYGWGTNNTGNLGNNTAVNNLSSPVSAFGGRSFSKIISGTASTFAIEASTGNMYSWGTGTTGQLGNGVSGNFSSPVSVVGGRSFSQVVVDNLSILALEGGTGNLFAWGDNSVGQLGQAVNLTTSNVPTSVAALLIGGKSFSTLNSNSVFNAAFGIESSTGILYAWGSNAQGQLGTNTATTTSAFAPTAVAGGRSFSQVTTGTQVALAIEISTGNAYAWGNGGSGTLGNNTIVNASSPVSVLGGRSFSQVYTQVAIAIALEASTGNAYAWGTNNNGQLGSGGVINASSPVSVVGGRSFSQLVTDGSSTVAIEGSTGHAYAWGVGTSGQLGTNLITSLASPASVVGGRSFSQVISGFGSCFYGVEGSTGHLYSWGLGTTGQLGNNLITNQSSPVSVVGGRSFSKAFAYNTTVIAIEGSTGNAYAWGLGTSGQLGNSLVASQSSPVSVVGGRSFNQIISLLGTTFAAIEGSTGNAYAWGLGTTGQLGGGAVVSASSPVSVLGGRSYRQILSNSTGLLAIEASTGNAYAWGPGTNGVLGNYNINGQSSPVSTIFITGLRSFSQIATTGGGTTAGAAFAAIEGSTGTVYCWGVGTAGQMGNNLTINQSSPASVVGGRSFNAISGAGVNPNGQFIALEASTGHMYSWGTGTNGQLANAAAANQSSPVSAVGARSFTQILATIANSFAIEGSTGNMYAAGSNTASQLGFLGNGTNTGSTSFVPVSGARSFQQIGATADVVMGLEASTGQIFTWGIATNGELGAYIASAQSSPVSVITIVGPKSFSQVSTNGTSSVALEASTGLIYSWGSGANGILGTNSTASTVSPVSVAGGRSFVQVIMGLNAAAALEGSTGLVYTWGINTTGLLGINTAASASSPTAVVGGRSYSSISNSGTNMAALEASTGHAYTWGANANGQIGNNTVANASSPMSVVGGRSFSQLVTVGGADSLPGCTAIEGSTGNMYIWGTGTGGQLGNNTLGNASSPMSVVGGRSFSQILPHSGGQNLAIEASTGTLYMWGKINNGLLGNNMDTFMASPVSIAGIPNNT